MSSVAPLPIDGALRAALARNAFRAARALANLA